MFVSLGAYSCSQHESVRKETNGNDDIIVINICVSGLFAFEFFNLFAFELSCRDQANCHLIYRTFLQLKFIAACDSKKKRLFSHFYNKYITTSVLIHQ